MPLVIVTDDDFAMHEAIDAQPARRFNVTVVASGTSGEGGGPPPSPVARCRGQPFASIPEDHALEESPIQQYLEYCSRSASPAPSWDFSYENSNNVKEEFVNEGMSNQNPEQEMPREISVDEVKRVLKRMKNKTSAGSGNMPIELIKSAPDIFLECSAFIFYKCLHGELPSKD
ncbi:hypothetical protein FQA39_LY12047 [Lamprigera yunnana]|nr:hypothetical protein FQA39_LY12047 [Lamprigera yunnana]